ncbi:DUF4124 domain-containing protein [Pseudomonas turukhanskensis]|uniref:DUF4124 domain-containing protein n=1 Tax=Pseudomonas turukhanskensis TaxID=1806536 RepID=A0A9W6ND31_9PSED|nr:DUF4124 domain-containing protein [Pseudomonas turukhanskensis]GLK87129.1 hypothetical protein GCM10017655_01910 [Pseudomonas turukhanskensis]
MLKLDVIRFMLVLGMTMPVMGLAADKNGAGGALLYRYEDAKGVTVLDRQGVPPELIYKGYEVLNEQGRVVQIVAPAPSLQDRQRLLDEKARASSDAQLLRLYSTLDDVERAKGRKLAELDGVISVARGNLASLKTQQANLQSQAADQERAGKQVPDHLVAQIENIKAEQVGLEGDIRRYLDGRKQAEASFNADRDRLKILLGTQ